MNHEYLAEIDSKFPGKTSFTIREVKYIWMVAFGYKIRKTEVMKKFGTEIIKKDDLVREIKLVSPFVDEGK